jgi:hypothetical protein
MMHEDIVESIAYEKGLNKCKTNYSREDVITAHTNEIVINWVKDNHPEVIEQIRKFVEDDRIEEDAE